MFNVSTDQVATELLSAEIDTFVPPSPAVCDAVFEGWARRSSRACD
jgi:hypothetical protein